MEEDDGFRAVRKSKVDEILFFNRRVKISCCSSL